MMRAERNIEIAADGQSYRARVEYPIRRPDGGTRQRRWVGDWGTLDEARSDRAVFEKRAKNRRVKMQGDKHIGVPLSEAELNYVSRIARAHRWGIGPAVREIVRLAGGLPTPLSGAPDTRRDGVPE